MIAAFIVPPPINDPPKLIDSCSVCGEAIYEGDEYYHMPDGMNLCGDIGCLAVWADDYRRI